MSQPLRITVDGKDYTYRIIKGAPVGRETQLVEVELDGQSLTLLRSPDGWIQEEGNEENERVIQGIGKAISLRYRL